MKIYDFIKEKRLKFLKAKLEMLKNSNIVDKDLQQVKDEIWDIEEENKFHIKGDQSALNHNIKESEYEGNTITFDDTYVYDIRNNYISKIDPNLDYFDDTENTEQRYDYEYNKRYGNKYK